MFPSENTKKYTFDIFFASINQLFLADIRLSNINGTWLAVLQNVIRCTCTYSWEFPTSIITSWDTNYTRKLAFKAANATHFFHRGLKTWSK